MRSHGSPVRAVLCIATTLLFLAPVSSQRPLGGAATRSIASMTLDERTHLPNNTMVTLKSGRTTSLGTLRAEHRARLERFSRAAGLGQMTAGKLAMHPASSTQLSPPATAQVRSAPGPATKSGGVNRGTVMQSPSLGGTVALLNSILVPLQIPQHFGTIPKDYVDFCKAAKASVCIYLPASTTLFLGEETWLWDEDPLIMDESVCKYDGGTGSKLYGCVFTYPVTFVTNFKPTGPLSTTASCDPPSKYVVDPKGAIQASYAYPSPTFTTGGTPITCVVQVWVGK